MADSQDVENQLGPEEDLVPSAGFPWGGFFFFLGLALVVIFAVQNTRSVPVTFLSLDGNYPLSIIILVTAVVVSAVTGLAGALYRRRRRIRRVEKHQLRTLKEQD